MSDAIPALTDQFPLVRRYFGDYLVQLLEALPYELPYFVGYAYEPEALERRLHRIEPLGQTQAILSEVGRIQDPAELDTRLRDAWAELRVLDQLRREGLESIRKVTEIADFTAQAEGRAYAFQVKRIATSLKQQIERRKPVGQRSAEPFGTFPEVHERFDGPVSWIFWDAVEEKSNRFRDWTDKSRARCIVIVSNDPDLQSPRLVRHIACQQIANDVHLLQNRHFEELLWLPDLGNGAWFTFGSRRSEARCLAEWSDSYWGQEEAEPVRRREVDLSGEVGAFRWNERGGQLSAT